MESCIFTEFVHATYTHTSLCHTPAQPGTLCVRVHARTVYFSIMGGSTFYGHLGVAVDKTRPNFGVTETHIYVRTVHIRIYREALACLEIRRCRRGAHPAELVGAPAVHRVQLLLHFALELLLRLLRRNALHGLVVLLRLLELPPPLDLGL